MLATQIDVQTDVQTYRQTHIHTNKRTLGRHQEVNTLENIEEKFIASVFDAFPAPANLASNL